MKQELSPQFGEALAKLRETRQAIRDEIAKAKQLIAQSQQLLQSATRKAKPQL